VRIVLQNVLGEWQTRQRDGTEKWFQVERTSNADVRCKAWGVETWDSEDWQQATVEPVKIDDVGDVVLGERNDRFYLDAFSEDTLVWVEAAHPDIWLTWTRGWRQPSRNVDKGACDVADDGDSREAKAPDVTPQAFQ
jgi:hypothetical protein